MSSDQPNYPRWAKEFLRFLPARSGFVLHGNIQDYHGYPLPAGSSSDPVWLFLDIEAYLHRLLKAQGYETVVFYDFIDGFRSRDGHATLDRFRRLAAGGPSGQTSGPPGRAEGGASAAPGAVAADSWPVGPNRAMDHVRAAVAGMSSVAVVVNLASRLVGDPQTLSEDEREVFSRLWKALREARQVVSGDQVLRNAVILLADKANDLPAWFYLDNPFVKLIHVDRPDAVARRRYIDRYLDDFYGGRDLVDAAERDRVKRAFTDLTDGMTSVDLEGLRLVSHRAGAAVGDVRGLVDLYRFGVRESPWAHIDGPRLIQAEDELRRRVKGQDYAIRQALDILKRARVGLSGVQQSVRSNRPKGLLFFAGPTGVGKTELAKGLAEILFSDEQACIRFDMSEYGHEHADQRLLGAPPGYIGYESGGQLTEAVRQRPFSIVLFDEIDKAHPSLYDKFLQIIDEGRLTDGRGETVYFSETVLIFTSNLGQYVEDDAGRRIQNVTPDMDYETVQRRMHDAIRDFFTVKLGRPEILNRFGENFVVFDYIRPPVAVEIMDKMIGNIQTRLLTTRLLRLELTPEVHAELLRRSLERLEFGGRGIGNVLEKCLINPLARHVFDRNLEGPGKLAVERIDEASDGTLTLTCRIEPDRTDGPDAGTGDGSPRGTGTAPSSGGAKE
ncbi:MAG: AAA family ATPase [Firmicutes bacterium]|nr:AAA family ATPase [Bacillota bacterium]